MTPELIRRLRETIMPGMQVLRDKCFVNGAHTHEPAVPAAFSGDTHALTQMTDYTHVLQV